MANPPEAIRRGADTAAGVHVLTPGTLASAAVAVCLLELTFGVLGCRPLALAAVRGRVHETLLNPQTLDDSQALADN